MKDLNVVLLTTSPRWNDPDGSIAEAEVLLEDAERAGTLAAVDLLVLPELWTTGFTLEPAHARESEAGGPGRAAMARWAERWQCAVVGSLAVATAEGTYANRMHFVRPDGSATCYDKRHLFGLGGEPGAYRPGRDRVEVEWRGWRILLLICYDLRFPIFSRNLGDPPYDAVIYSACWPAPRIAAWDTLLAARAIENQCYAIGVNRCGTEPGPLEYPGHSAVYNPLGACTSANGHDALPQMLHVLLDFAHLSHIRHSLPFLRDADRS